MKNLKKLVSLLLALVLAMSMTMTAFAVENKTITMVSSLTGASVEGHTYEVYQIFVGDVSKSDDVLSNAAYGQNYTDAEKSVEDAMAELSVMSGEAAAAFLKGEVTGEAFTVLNEGNDWTVSVPTGYYLIVDVSDNLPATETASAFVLELTGNTEIKSKHDSQPVTEKKVDDKNDTTGAEDAIEWHDSADHDINDIIDFQLSATIPSDFGAFKAANKAYRFVFHDKESEGLTFDSTSVKAYVVNDTTTTPIEKTQYSVNTGLTDGCTFEVVFSDLTQISEVTVGSKIVVEYKSQLNENAIIGPTGNPNEMRGEFSNFNTPETPEFTPWDKVIVFTYEYDVDKVDSKGDPLKGAGFTLYKKQANGEWVAVSNEIKGEEITRFEFKGLDDGTYKLVETTVPDGYNKAADVEFTITATHDELSADPKLLTLTVDNTKINVGADKDGNLTGKLDSDIENKSGTTLPETGGMGTTMFYVVGAILAIGAAVILVTKKRMNEN
ncbi:MAG: isopeptide-forming domain-containing fimbrial protein [Schaedlerella sp.]|nr:isopeptide-forming domain-containing fimbrial protein [Schaedlerella sp.]